MDDLEMTLEAPELPTTRQEEVFLLPHILPPSVLALIEQTDVTDSHGEIVLPVGH